MTNFTTNSQYNKFSAKWGKCRDVVAGQDAIHDGATRYLPQGNKSDDGYKRYLDESQFYNASSRTVDVLTGMVMRKQPQVIASNKLLEQFEDITLTGKTLTDLTAETVREQLTTGRRLLLLEYPKVENRPKNLAEEEASNIRPYVVEYDAEHILHWRCERVNNVYMPTMIALLEEHPDWTDDFTCKSNQQVRVLRLKDGVYSQAIYNYTTEGKEGSQPIEELPPPVINGSTLNYIPAVFFNGKHNQIDVELPPLYDLFNLNITHYQQTANYYNGLYFAGHPTPYVTGYSPEEGEVIPIGEDNIFSFPNAESKAGYMEVSGAAFEANRLEIDRIEKQMAVVGARMLHDQKNSAEATETVLLHHSADTASLSTVAKTTQSGLRRLLGWWADWTKQPEVEYTINTDFLDVSISPQELTSWVAAWQAGGVSHDTLLHNVQRGEGLPDGRTIEEEMELIEAEAPVLAEDNGDRE